MALQNKALAICIPTYNRPNELIDQVNFIISECKNIDDVEIYVRDNCSKNFPSVEIRALKNNCQINILENSKNIGLVGNLIRLTEDAIGCKYIWFVGDDDRLYPGVVKKVLFELRSSPDFVFINHRAVTIEGSVAMASALPIRPPRNLLDVMNYSGTTMMFITACVYKTDKLIESTHKYTPYDRLSAPLYWSFYAASNGNTKYIESVQIDNVWGGASWLDNSRILFLRDVPHELFRCMRLNYGFFCVMKSLFVYVSRIIVARFIK